ncbi:class I SAM-dependent methyltransferase [Verrucosispora sp. CWR15]|uniref:Class I SAM-dependent methyltransferase n=1 Tax=Verrucosispora sioxanthis TaxID=2499994 RepID=A0A6M1L801_9ACTN|nr:class I SAM-dependent methyltransferase [Verrucosispora sioxanthis]NEE65241.1 class I SAM-dependent methyltransferase [Verrucosispora sioxanthis]NGM14351.1 class I SAM-dependent methyltransferase [Verrucosispora sioxanthis]
MTEPGDTRAQVSPADLIERARRANVFFRASYEGTDPQRVRLPGAAVDELIQGLASGVHRELCQIVPYSAVGRPADLFSRAVFGQLARRATIRRMYLVPGEDVGSVEVDRQVDEDRQHHLHPVKVAVRIGGEATQVPMTGMWLIDRQVVVRQETGRDGMTSWVVSRHSEDVQRASLLWEALMRRAPASGAPQPAPGPELTRSLLQSAKMLYAMAPMSCGPSHQDSANCSWYHSAWQYLRLFDMVSSPQWHAEFYNRRLVEAVRDGARRVLISGTADYTTLAFVLDAIRSVTGELPGRLDVHVVDKCQTPLLACQWYARQLGTEIHGHQADITCPDTVRQLTADGKYDLVVADAFLTRFDRGTATTVIDSWSALLRPGGTVVTTVRLHAGNEWPSVDGQDNRHQVTDLVDDFELRFRERAASWRGLLQVQLEELSTAVRRYATRMVSHDLGDADDVRAAFGRRGFTLAETDVGEVDGELVRTKYLRLCAALSHDDSARRGG